MICSADVATTHQRLMKLNFLNRMVTLGWLSWLACVCFGSAEFFARAENVFYQPVPGLAPSDKYTVRVCSLGSTNWQPLFVWKTVSVPNWTNDAYWQVLSNWTHSYVNFELDTPVEVEISRVDGVAITNVAPHPASQVAWWAAENGKAYLTMNHPANVAVDINKQMDGQDTGYMKPPGVSYHGPPIHTISIHANPPLADRPDTNDPSVYVVRPGVVPPSTGTWSTLYFLPGVHHIGLAFPIHANKNYYIPGDALVYGTFSNTKWSDGHNIRFFGYGTLSGALWQNPTYVPGLAASLYNNYQPINVLGGAGSSVEGLTIIDPPYHSVMFYGPYEPTNYSVSSWVKVFGWRKNGDGINPFANGVITNCFLRTQDDCCYACGVGISGTVFWNDANGSAFVLSDLVNYTNPPLLIHDCEVIYARAAWINWSGGRVFDMRGEGAGGGGAGIIFSNIYVSDPRPTMQTFFVGMTVPPPYCTVANGRTAGDMAGVVFKNVTIAVTNRNAEPEMLWGESGAEIHDLTFDNLKVGGVTVLANIFATNGFVYNLHFTNSTPVMPVGMGMYGGRFGFSITNSGSYVGLGGTKGQSIFSITNNGCYLVQASASSSSSGSWVSVYTNTAPFTFVDTTALDLPPTEFYRVVSP